MLLQSKTRVKSLSNERDCENEQEEIDLFIIDDQKYGKEIKRLIEERIPENVNVKIFSSGESVLREIRNNEKKPRIVLLDYTRNKMNSRDHAVDHILENSPDTDVIMLSDKEYKDRALKALGYGAHDYVEKDQFAHDHILDSVKTALHPSKE